MDEEKHRRSAKHRVVIERIDAGECFKIGLRQLMGYWLRKRDGSRVYAMHLPDGSWFEMPAPDDSPLVAIAPVPEIAPPVVQTSTAGSVRQFLREIGKRGGQARARRHSREELAGWGAIRHKNQVGKLISGAPTD